MTYSNKEQTHKLNPGQKSPAEDRPRGSLSSAGLPNSLIEGMFAEDNHGNPDSGNVVQRQEMHYRQIPSAEAEADDLSADIRGRTPDAIRREMGARLNSDFSAIRFHSDAASESRAARMGARAWTSGGDVYFGKGGFEPQIAAHELVHTVQQGAARGSVSQTVVPGTIQMWSLWPFGKKKESKYDTISSPSEEADFLFRTQAGISASIEKQNAEKDEVYEQTFRKEIGKNRSRERADRIAQNKKNRLKTKFESVASSSDMDQFSNRIRNISFNTYEELIRRRDEEAGKLVRTYKDLFLENEDKGKSTFEAANSTEGRNYKLYNSIIQKIELEHSREQEFKSWKKRINNAGGKNEAATERTRMMAFEIIEQGKLSGKNQYFKTDEGMRSRTAGDKESEQYYRDVYAGKKGPKKKNRLDRMADEYRQAGFGKKKLISLDESDSAGRRDNVIRNDSGNDIFRKNIISNEDPISEKGMKEKNDESFAGNNGSDSLLNKGMPEKDYESSDENAGSKSLLNNGILDIVDESVSEDHGTDSLLIKGILEKGGESSGEDNDSDSLLNKGMLEIGDKSFSDYLVPDNAGKKKDLLDIAVEEEKAMDPFNIVRQKGMVTEELANKYVPSSPGIGKGKKVNNQIGYYNNLGKGANSIAQIGMLTNHVDIKSGNNIYSNIIGPAAAAGTGLIGFGTGAAGFITGIHDTQRNFRNVDAGGSRMEYINSGIDTLGSGALMAAGGMAALQNADKIPFVGETLASIGNSGGANLVPGLNMATGAATAFTGAVQGISGQSSINTIDDQIRELKEINPLVKDRKDQKKLKKIFQQGRRVSELRRTGGALKFLSGGITAGTGFALASGLLAPLTLAVMATIGTGIGIGKYFYEKKKKKNLRKDVTAGEMGINWDREITKVKRMFKNENLSDKEARAIILKGHGFEEGTRSAAFKKINQDRAKTLMDTFKKGGRLGGIAQKVISALGVHRKKGRYAAGAEKLLAEKLGG